MLVTVLLEDNGAGHWLFESVSVSSSSSQESEMKKPIIEKKSELVKLLLYIVNMSVMLF